jgi:hypothetical protein
MNSSKIPDKDLQNITGLVARIPDVDSPDTVVFSVMGRIQARRLSAGKRLWRRMRMPLSVTPLKLASLGAALAAVLVLAVFIGPVPQKDAGPGSRARLGTTVVFTLDRPEASTVAVIGSFNEWRPGNSKMRWDEARKRWILHLELEKGRHEYAFLVDGSQIVPDPEALLQQPDGFGNQNSILIVEGGDNNETAI